MPPYPDIVVKLSSGTWRTSAQGWFPYIAGGDGPEDDGDDDDEGGSQNRPKTFTQDDVARMAAKEKREGRKAAIREVMETLGFDTVEQAKEFMAEVKAKADGQDNDVEKRRSRAAEAEARAIEKERKATRRLNEASVLSELIGGGMEKAKAARMVKAVDVDLDDDALDAGDITDAIVTLREEMPELFGTTKDDEDGPPDTPAGNRFLGNGSSYTPDSTPRGGSRRLPKGVGKVDQGRQRYLERHPKKS